MNKSQYFEELNDIITDPIYQAQNTSDIIQEIAKNMWCISMPSELTEEVNSEDYMEFFSKVIAYRQEQVNTVKGSGMIFYLWFDVMANQLRFNLISDFNKELPFKCDIQEVTTINEVISESLSRITYKLQDDIKQDIEETKERYTLKIYKTILLPQ